VVPVVDYILKAAVGPIAIDPACFESDSVDESSTWECNNRTPFELLVLGLKMDN
jgi:hypothetical protein